MKKFIKFIKGVFSSKNLRKMSPFTAIVDGLVAGTYAGYDYARKKKLI